MGLLSFLCLLISIAALFIPCNSVSYLQPSCTDHERLSLHKFIHSFRVDCNYKLSPFARPKLTVLDVSNNDDFSVYSDFNLRLDDPTFNMLVQNLTSLQILNLQQVDISSPFPTILTNLTSLKVLSLELCEVYGELPPEIFRLPQLEILNLRGNTDLTGSLPHSEWSSPLKQLHLCFTALSGEFPPSIGKLPQLEILEAARCQFSGLLPSSLGNLTTLTMFNLIDNNFQSDISFSITNLTNLHFLVLPSLNVRPGELLSQLHKLHKLTGLGLSGLELDSEIASLLGNFTKIQLLDLGNTNLKGSFPKWLANLTQLTDLYLNDNELEGPIPQWVSHLTNLNLLHLSKTNFFVEFDTFFSLKNLVDLDLSGTKVSFPPNSETNSSLLKLENLQLSRCNLIEFPQVLRYQNRLQYLSLDDNNIWGRIPQWFVDITKDSLSIITLSGNNLIGFEQPTKVLPWSNLKVVDLSYNKLKGQLPIPPVSTKHYSVSSNLFSGDIPDQICNARSLRSLDLSKNKMSGKIPYCIISQLGDYLQVLDLRSNNLHGAIPQAFSSSCRMKMINLSQNQLQGELPRSLVNCSMLEVLDIGRNYVNDTFPSWLGRLPKLQVLVLSHNSFHGSVVDPKSDLDFRFLRILDLSHNLLTGDLPSRYLQNFHEMCVSKEDQSTYSYTKITFFSKVGPKIFENEKRLEYSITLTNKGSERLYVKILKLFKVMDLSSNNFTGRIPNIIGNLQGLQALNLSNNNLNGRIPSSLANITDLESLDLSMNNLSGEIPPGLLQLTFLEVFNVSYNQLEGPIPEANQFSTFDDNSYVGNIGLCGSLISKKCGNIGNAPLQEDTIDEGNQDSELVDWIIRLLGCLSGCIVGYVIGKQYITDKYDEWFKETFGRHRPKRRVEKAVRQRR
ncbi:unnamed protein product [Amaranthus hypochondriacus]